MEDAPRYRRVLITGSRTWTDIAVIRRELAKVWHPACVLVSGACPRGADHLCEGVWTGWGGVVEQHPADWDRHGKVAGHRRNAVMAHLGADLCLAFLRDGSPGTMSMIRLARRANIPVRKYEQ